MTVAMEKIQETAKSRFPLGKALKAVGILPGMMFRLTRAHRGFSNSFVKEAARFGIPESVAREIAEELRPMQMLKIAGKGKNPRTYSATMTGGRPQ